MTPKQRVAVFVKAQATKQLKNKQALNTYLADWPQIKEANRNNPRIYWMDPGKATETQDDLDQALAECKLYQLPPTEVGGLFLSSVVKRLKADSLPKDSVW